MRINIRFFLPACYSRSYFFGENVPFVSLRNYVQSLACTLGEGINIPQLVEHHINFLNDLLQTKVDSIFLRKNFVIFCAIW